VRQSLKAELLKEISERLAIQLTRNNFSQLQIRRITHHLQKDLSNTLILGFARRFATYKRATLLFSDAERLARLLNNSDQPVIILFAGKAHPSDMPGQHLIKVIHDFSRQPEFEGKVILLENYDLALGRALVSGVDVWLNTPEYPLEASGTSGEKAGINGVLNLSILDGWWGEGYSKNHGWAITPHGPQYDNTYRNQEEARELLDLLEHEVIPCYFSRNNDGFSDAWIQRSKNSMKQIIPRFNAQRMVMDYVRKFYGPASREGLRLAAAEFEKAKQLSQWKKQLLQLWPGVKINSVKPVPPTLHHDEEIQLQVSVHLNGLDGNDLVVECLFGTESAQGNFIVHEMEVLYPDQADSNGDAVYKLNMAPPLPGLQYYKFRVYPCHEALVHPLETGKMIWI
jgi:starch phosphorylase